VDGGMHVWAISVRGGAAGTRESMVALEMMRDGTLSEETYKKSWNADPYDPKYRGVPPDSLRCMADDERYDAEYPDHPLSQVRRVLRELADPEDTRRAYADLSTLECGSLELAVGIRILTLRVAERGKKLRAGAVSDALNRSHLALLAPADPEAPHGVLLDLRDTGYVFAGEDLTHVMMTMTLLGLSRGAPLPCAILGDAETLEALRTRLAKAHEGGNFILKRFCLTGSEDEAFAHLRQSIAQA